MTEHAMSVEQMVEEARAFVRMVMCHLGQEVDEATVDRVARKIAKGMPAYPTTPESQP